MLSLGTRSPLPTSAPDSGSAPLSCSPPFVGARSRLSCSTGRSAGLAPSASSAWTRVRLCLRSRRWGGVKEVGALTSALVSACFRDAGQAMPPRWAAAPVQGRGPTCGEDRWTPACPVRAMRCRCTRVPCRPTTSSSSTATHSVPVVSEHLIGAMAWTGWTSVPHQLVTVGNSERSSSSSNSAGPGHRRTQASSVFIVTSRGPPGNDVPSPLGTMSVSLASGRGRTWDAISREACVRSRKAGGGKIGAHR